MQAACRTERLKARGVVGGLVPSLFLLHWDVDEAEAWADELRELGWVVEVGAEAASQAYRDIRADIPDVVVVDLETKTDWGFQAAEAVRRARWGHEVPFIFIGGNDDDALLSLREFFPEASYIERDELPAALAAHWRPGQRP